MDVLAGLFCAVLYFVAGLFCVRHVVNDWIDRYGEPQDLSDHAALGFIAVGVFFFWWAFLVIIGTGYFLVELTRKES